MRTLIYLTLALTLFACEEEKREISKALSNNDEKESNSVNENEYPTPEAVIGIKLGKTFEYSRWGELLDNGYTVQNGRHINPHYILKKISAENYTWLDTPSNNTIEIEAYPNVHQQVNINKDKVVSAVEIELYNSYVNNVFPSHVKSDRYLREKKIFNEDVGEIISLLTQKYGLPYTEKDDINDIQSCSWIDEPIQITMRIKLDRYLSENNLAKTGIYSVQIIYSYSSTGYKKVFGEGENIKRF